MFKGTIHERNQPKRQQEIETRMKGMQKRVDAWKKVCLASNVGVVNNSAD